MKGSEGVSRRTRVRRRTFPCRFFGRNPLKSTRISPVRCAVIFARRDARSNRRVPLSCNFITISHKATSRYCGDGKALSVTDGLHLRNHRPLYETLIVRQILTREILRTEEGNKSPSVQSASIRENVPCEEFSTALSHEYARFGTVLPARVVHFSSKGLPSERKAPLTPLPFSFGPR